MSTPSHQTPQNKVDLRWPRLGEGLATGFFVLGAISVVCILLHWFYPKANLNPWLVTQASDDLFSKSLVSVLTTHFFHGSDKHLWGNLLFMWPVGLAAFAIAGPYRGLAAIGYGIFFAGMAQYRAGIEGAFYMGSSSIVFAFLGVIILASIRKGLILTILMVFGIGLLGDSFFDTIRPTEASMVMGISWLGHLGGLIGGFTADLKDPTEAIRVLHNSGTIDEAETESLLKRACPGNYLDELNQEFEKKLAAETETINHGREQPKA